MGMVEDVCAFLDEGSTGLITGTTLFAHTMPELGPASLPTMVLQVEPGGEAARTYGAKMPIGVTPTLVLVTRTTAPSESDYVDPRRALGMAWDAWRLLEQTANVTVPTSSTSGTFLYAVLGETEPTYVGRDERRRAVFEQRLVIDYRPSTDSY